MAFLKNIVDTRKTFDDKHIMFVFVNSSNHIKFFSVVLKSVMEPEWILLNINPIPIRQITTRAFPVRMFHVIEKVCVLKS